MGVGVVEESRLIKKEERVEISLGDPGISDGDPPTGDAGSSVIRMYSNNNL